MEELPVSFLISLFNHSTYKASPVAPSGCPNVNAMVQIPDDLLKCLWLKSSSSSLKQCLKKEKKVLLLKKSFRYKSIVTFLLLKLKEKKKIKSGFFIFHFQQLQVKSAA